MGKTRNIKYWLEKKAKRKTGYPIGTIAFYGPDNSRASKVVVGIILSQQEKEVSLMKKWFSDDSDVRVDPKILREVFDFIEEKSVQRVVMVDRIFGCPHEEGVDYPEGENCPQCPYWASVDRWTGEKKGSIDE